MNIENIKSELDKAFGKYEFIEEGHYYLVNKKRVGISVTTFLHSYASDFDVDRIAPMSAIKLGLTVEETLKLWDYKRDFACDKGTTCHEYNQSLWSGEKWKRMPFDRSTEYLMAVEKIRGQADKFYKENKEHLIHIKDEQLVGDEDYDIASAVDHLFFDKRDNTLIIVDYKTNSVLKGYDDDSENAWYTKNLKPPLHKLKDTSFNHYKIQMGIYKFLIEKNTNLKIGKLLLVHMTELKEDYEIIEIPYLKQQVEKMLENRRVRNMKSIPVLLYGKSGSGKTASFRNYKKEELAYINILDKPLPFKSDIKVNALDTYESIIAGIKGTKRKTIFIDDAGFLMTNYLFAKINEKGYTKFEKIASDFENFISEIKKIEGGKVVVFSMHEQNNDGEIALKTAGKMVDNLSVIEGNITIAIRSVCTEGTYLFSLRNNGHDITKTPIGMFENAEMENDFKVVDEAIREYYDLDKEEEKAKEIKKEEEK